MSIIWGLGREGGQSGNLAFQEERKEEFGKEGGYGERKEKLGREGGSADIALSLSNEQIGKLGRFVMDKAYRDIER